MEENIEQQIEQKLGELPEVVREALLSNDVSGHVRAIGSKHKLHIDQMSVLDDITIMTMLGFISPLEFSTQIKAQLNLDEESAKKLADEINTEIFLVVRESMKNASQPAPATAAVKIATPVPPPAPAPKPIEPHPADIMLTQKTVTTAPSAPMAPKPATPPAPPQAPKPATPPVTPQPYKADPYREPTE